MTAPGTRAPETPPSGGKLLLTTVVAAIVAAVVLVTAILPAELGIDPLGIGRALGLTAIAEPPAAAPASDASASAAASTHVAIMTDSRELLIDPYQYVEYKYRLEKGATMVYAWTASVAPIVDFHGDADGLLPRDGSRAPEPTSYDKTSRREATGSFTAPFLGVHGWYWENPGGEPLTVNVQAVGFFSNAIEFRSPRVRRTHPVTPLERLLVPPTRP